MSIILKSVGSDKCPQILDDSNEEVKKKKKAAVCRGRNEDGDERKKAKAAYDAERYLQAYFFIRN